MNRASSRSLFACGLAVVVSACGGPGTNVPARPELTPLYDPSTGSLRELSYDSNNDGRLDMKGFMAGGRLMRAEIDEDGDGRTDAWEYYEGEWAGDASAASWGRAGSTRPTGRLARVERATRHDGKITRWEEFEGGLLASVKEDTDADGNVDKWETYVGGALSVLELDTKRRGQPTHRLTYREGGVLDRIEVDEEGSGQFRLLREVATEAGSLAPSR